MSESRTKNSLKNSFISLASFIIVAILQFVNRSVFVNFLSADYLGLNGLFSNIISFLTLAELGIGSAMTYALYKPLKNNDFQLIKSIMHLYKKMYTSVGIFIILIGIALSPYLNWFIKDIPDIPYISLFYCTYVINSGVSYFYTYKRTIIICDQKQYISSLSTTVKTVVMSLVQILILVLTKNYFLYILVMIFCTIVENLIVSNIANKLYPYLTEKNILPLDNNKKNEIKKNISAMILHKVGSMIIFSTDNIIISKYVGLVSVGIYSNYVLITNTLANAISQIFNSLTASIGNLLAHEDIKHSKTIFNNLLFINFWFYSFSTISLFCLLNPFISLWIGKQYTFTNISTLIICLNFYFTGMRRTVGIFKEAAGLFWNDRFKPLFESLINLALSIPLTIRFGVAGTILGTIITTILISIPIEAYVLFKNYFKKSSINYFIKQFIFLFLTIAIGFITWNIISIISFSNNYITFIVQFFLCIILPNIFIAIIFYRSPEFKYYLNLFKNYIIKLLLKYNNR